MNAIPDIVLPTTSLFPARESVPLNLDARDSVAIVFFMALGMITRFFRIFFPNELVFDEVHFGNFTNWYIRQEYFHDIHPPLAKLIMFLVAVCAGYKGNLDFEKSDKGVPYSDMIYVSLRSTPAFFGAMCVPLAYLAIRIMRGRHLTAAIGAVMIASDLTLIVEARHILSDGILHFFACLSICGVFLFERYPKWPALIFEGFCLGCVAACKYTSGGILIMAFMRQFTRCDEDANSNDSERSATVINVANAKKFFMACWRCVFLGICIVVIQYAMFWIHLSVLPYEPSGGPNMPYSVRTGLVRRDKPNWESRQNAQPMIKRITELMIWMHRGNMGISSDHPYGSQWWSWPLFTRKWVLYWTKDGRHIMCLGNVLLWWPVFFGVLINAFLGIINMDYFSEEMGTVFGYAFSLLPFALIKRQMFLYHYSIPLIFAIYGLNLLIERHCGAKTRGFLFCLFLAMDLFGFFLWCPWVYGLTTPDFWFLVWNHKWR
jgi:dolichyl-phosphate-mannose--protein O-mannosyl transferase